VISRFAFLCHGLIHHPMNSLSINPWPCRNSHQLLVVNVLPALFCIAVATSSHDTIHYGYYLFSMILLCGPFGVAILPPLHPPCHHCDGIMPMLSIKKWGLRHGIIQWQLSQHTIGRLGAHLAEFAAEFYPVWFSCFLFLRCWYSRIALLQFSELGHWYPLQ